MNPTPRVAANRQNALKSTGPRTPEGKAVVAANPVRAGLFARTLVIPALGEGADEFEMFRAAVATDLDPVGPVEGELVDRAAGLMWRLRRVARSEAAAAATLRLPPHPDEVTAGAVDSTLPLPPNATAEHRLARVRDRLRHARRLAEGVVAAANVARGLADPPPGRAVSPWTAEPVLAAAGGLLGWSAAGGTDPWDGVTTGLGFANPRAAFGPWTVEQLRDAVRAAAQREGHDPDRFLRAVVDRVAEGLTEAEASVAALEVEERNLAGRLLAERERAAAAGVLADPGLVERVARAEGHLSRELERVLAMLERLQGRRRGAEGWAAGVVVGLAGGGRHGPAGGFVLPDGPGCRPLAHAKPEPYLEVPSGRTRAADAVSVGGRVKDQVPASEATANGDGPDLLVARG